MLTVKDVHASYGPSRALFGMNLLIKSGQMVSLMGRNGMGKTTTVRAITGLLPVTSGRIEFDETLLTGLSSHRIARTGIGLVPEGRRIFPNLTVKENLIAFSREVEGRYPWTEDRVYSLFPQLANRRRHMGHELSGGEQQMLAIGRALMTNPLLLILDEATEGLAPRVRSFIWKTLAALKARGLSILVIDKNIDALMKICDHHHIVVKGRVVWNGNSEELARRPDYREKYLGV